MNSPKRITLNDIALRLGISKVAVSKALRDHPDISPATRARVKQMAESLGYVPNYMARNLSARKTLTVGLVVPKIAHHFFSQAIEAIYETAEESNYEIILTVSREDESRERRQIKTLLSMRVDGLLVSLAQNTRRTDIFKEVRDHGLPLVFFDRVPDEPGYSAVTTDDRQGAFEAVAWFASRGYRKIAHIGGFPHTSIGRKRARGYRRAMEQYGCDLPSGFIVEGGFSEEDGYRGLMKIYDRVGLPEVLFTVTFPVALGAVRAMQDLGKSVPDDMQIVSFGGSAYSRYMKPAISYFDQPAREIGKTATNMLLEEIGGRQKSGRFVELPGKLILSPEFQKELKK